MSAFWITFCIADARVGSRDYRERYCALVDTLRADSLFWWDEPTSYVAFESNFTIQEIAKRCKSAIAPTHDLFLIREMDKQAALICGKNSNQDIYKLMPYLKSA